MDAPAAAAIDRQKYGIEASPHEQKACIEEIKGDMSQLQVAMKDTVFGLFVIFWRWPS